MTDTILARVVEIVNGIAGPSRIPAQVGPETPLWEGGYWLHSTELLEVMLACEKAFEPLFGKAEGSVADSLRTVGSLGDWVRARARP